MENDILLTELRRRIQQNIRMLRSQRGLTQKDLAQKAGIVQSTLSYIEAEEKSPTVDTLALIAKALNVTWEDILPPLDELTSKVGLLQDQTAALTIQYLENKDSEHIPVQWIILYHDGRDE